MQRDQKPTKNPTALEEDKNVDVERDLVVDNRNHHWQRQIKNFPQYCSAKHKSYMLLKEDLLVHMHIYADPLCNMEWQER